MKILHRVKRRWEWLKLQKIGNYLFWSLLAAAVIFAIKATDFGQRFEFQTVDFRFKARAFLKWDPPADERIYFVQIDEESIRDFGQWPWLRSRHAEFIQVVSEMAPEVISFDLLFSEERPTDEDRKATLLLIEQLTVFPTCVMGAKTDNVGNQKGTVLGAQIGMTRAFSKVEGSIENVYGRDYATLPLPGITENTFLGFVDSDPFSDGVRRRSNVIIRVGNYLYPSLGLQSILILLGVSPDDVVVRIGKEVEFTANDKQYKIPVDQEGMTLVNYRKESTFQECGYTVLMKTVREHLKEGKPWPQKYPNPKGKILLVGQQAVGLTDFGPSPYGPLSPNVLVHANFISNVLRQDFLKVISWSAFFPGWILVLIGSLVALRKKPILYAALTPVMISVVYVIIAFLVFGIWSIQVPIFFSVLGFLGVHTLVIVQRWREEEKSKEQIKKVFSSLVTPQVVDRLMSSGANIRMGGETKPVTILFSDIRSFTTFSEGVGPEELVRQLNEYFDPMVESVFDTNGTLQKYIGDAIMAVWGDVVSEGPEKDARNAVTSALEMREELREVNAQRATRGLVPLKIGIGLNHGDVLVGMLGSERRKEFTVIGDAVNLASRLEGLTKEFHTDLAIGESVRQFLDDSFLVRTLGNIQVKGKTKPVRVYEVLDDDPQLREWVRWYEVAFESYLARRFEEARKGFEGLLLDRPDDYCSELYRKACVEFIKSPPDADWIGTVVMTSK